jgi:hypothetical protein
VTVFDPRSTLLFVRVLVELIVGTATPSTANTPADERDKVVSVAPPISMVPPSVNVPLNAAAPDDCVIDHVVALR